MKKHSFKLASTGLFLSVFASMIAGAVRADIIPEFNAASAIVGGCEFIYNARVASGSKVNTNDYFTIYDFNGYVSGSAFAPVNWSIITQNTGLTPSGVDPNAFSGDDPNVVNITFKYTGVASIIGPVLLGGPGAFGADSTFCGLNGLGTYASMAHKYNPGHPDNNTRQANGGYLVTPAVPEASSLMLLVPGLLPVGLMLRKRARK